MPVGLTDVTMPWVIGMAQANMLEGPLFSSPHVFVEKQVIAVTIANAFLDGTTEAIPYSYCEVYAPTELMSDVCRGRVCE